MEQCAASFSQHGGLFAVFFLGGLTGGFTHCLGMCGPIVASEVISCGSSCGGCGRASEYKKAGGLSYHLGRMTTYGALGFMVALISKQVTALPFWPWLSAAMLFAAGAIFLASSVPGCRHSLFKTSGKITYLRGVMLGFMPCGLLYAALMMAATLANPFSGLIAMWLFTLGTIPALLIASGGAHLLSKKRQDVVSGVGRALMAFNGLSLLVMAVKIVR